MSNQILKDLPELTEAGVISGETAEKIRSFYLSKAKRSPNRLVIVFGILGAMLMGMGIILIIAHNWDDLSKPVKLFFALVPLLLGQAICAFCLVKKAENREWLEAGSVFLFFAIGASISIVSQVYNIHGTLSGFLLVWIALSVPVIYVMQSAMTSLLAIACMTWYACELSYFDYPTEIAWYYWLMLASVIPFFIRLIHRGSRNFFFFHCWFLALSVIITLGMFSRTDEMFMFIAYMSLFSLFLLIGGTKWLSDGKIINNAFLVTGSLGSTILLLMLTFDFIWKEIARTDALSTQSLVTSAMVSLLAVVTLFLEVRRIGFAGVNPKGYLFIVFIFLFLLGIHQPGLSQWLTNVLVLGVAVTTTWRGAGRDNMLILNYGLLILTALILCRFFDSDLSFVVRGLLFIAVGLSFFGANYWLLRKRKLQQV